MFDEEGRKIDFGLHIGMTLDGMSLDELDHYISELKMEIERVETEKEKLKAHNEAANAMFQ
jgi:uncharacterized small protein (DUF1192 family)